MEHHMSKQKEYLYKYIALHRLILYSSGLSRYTNHNSKHGTRIETTRSIRQWLIFKINMIRIKIFLTKRYKYKFKISTISGIKKSWVFSSATTIISSNLEPSNKDSCILSRVILQRKVEHFLWSLLRLLEVMLHNNSLIYNECIIK